MAGTRRAAAAPIRGLDELAALGKRNLAAAAAAGEAAAKGWEEIGKEVSRCAQSSLASAAGAARALLGATTLTDVIAVQNDYAKAVFDDFIANSARLTEIGARIAGEAMQPLSAPAGAALERPKAPAAA